MASRNRFVIGEIIILYMGFNIVDSRRGKLDARLVVNILILMLQNSYSGPHGC